MRIDKYLHNAGLAASRTEAGALIRLGAVSLRGKPITKPSYEVGGCITEQDITVDKSGMKFVGRGGLKLEAALDAFDITVSESVAIDIGASTGGFTDCLLKRGAKRVYAVDCGRNQLHELLRMDPRVVTIDNFNARYLNRDIIGEECSIAVMDVSFISQTLIFEGITTILTKGGVLISLIKPQFEAGREAVGKNGIVKSKTARRFAVERVISAAKAADLHCGGLITSPVLGGDGNIEYLALFYHGLQQKTYDYSAFIAGDTFV